MRFLYGTVASESDDEPMYDILTVGIVSEIGGPMEPHAPLHTAGKIIVPDGRTFSCTIIDISDKGATLKLVSIFGIPETFDLLIGTDPATERHCKVIHKAPNRLDILFE